MEFNVDHITCFGEFRLSCSLFESSCLEATYKSGFNDPFCEKKGRLHTKLELAETVRPVLVLVEGMKRNSGNTVVSVHKHQVN